MIRRGVLGARGAITHLRNLSLSDGALYRADLVRCSLSHSVTLYRFDKFDAACKASLDAVELCKGDPEPDCAFLAACLDQYGIALHQSDHGTEEEECNAKEEAVRCSCQAYKGDPGKHGIDYAKHLFSLAASLDNTRAPSGSDAD